MNSILSAASLTGYIFDRRGCLAIFSGILTALSFPTPGLSFLAWIALIPLLVSLRNSSLRTAARLGFTSGFTAFAIILYWLNNVLVQYGHLSLGVSIPVYLMLVAWLALFCAASTFFARVAESAGINIAFTLPFAWVAMDFIRSFLFSGFPWGMLGHTQYRTLPLIQVADLAGVYGITFLIVFANIVLYRIGSQFLRPAGRYPVKSALILIILLNGTLYYGFSKLNMPDQAAGAPIKVALIQGNIPQDVKWSPTYRDKTMDIYERLTRTAANSRVDLIVWPESATPFFFQDEPVQAARIKKLVIEMNAFLLFGSPAYEFRNSKNHYLNSAFLMSPSGQIIGRADKLHLVPFGEYVPLGNILTFIQKMVVGMGDFSPGQRPVVLQMGETNLGIQICYEIIFPELAREYVNSGAKVLVAITNDAWFGRTSAPYQHLAISIFRAIETRTPLIRAANTGITAIVDSNGHILTMTDIFVEDYRTGEIRPGRGESTYTKSGEIAAWLSLLITAGILIIAIKRNREKQPCSEKKQQK